MAYWLYQMRADQYSHERYRTEVWEGNPVTNWSIGESNESLKKCYLGIRSFFSSQKLGQTNQASTAGVL